MEPIISLVGTLLLSGKSKHTSFIRKLKYRCFTLFAIDSTLITFAARKEHLTFSLFYRQVIIQVIGQVIFCLNLT